MGGKVVDHLGRYKLLILDLILFVAAAIAGGLAPNMTWLLVCRFFLGIGVGIDMPAALSLVSEFSRSKDKGKYVNFWQLIWYCATVSSALLVLIILSLAGGDHLWRWAVGLGAVPALAILILRLIFADESPMWAAHNLGVEAAVGVLRKNYRETFVIENAPDVELTSRARISGIFRSPYGIRTLLASVVSGGQAVQYFAIGFYIPIIIGTIFGKGIYETLLGTAAINVFGLIGGGVQPFLSFRFGLRRLAIIGCVVCVAALLLIGILPSGFSGYLIALLLGIFIMAHSFGPGSQGKSIAALSYPTELRGLGTGWAEAMSRAGTILGFALFPLVLAATNVSVTLLLFAAVPLLMLITLLCVKWEPAGKNVESGVETVPPSKPEDAG